MFQKFIIYCIPETKKLIYNLLSHLFFPLYPLYNKPQKSNNVKYTYTPNENR